MKSDGGQSERCLDNTGDRTYLPIEFDISESGPWAPYVAEWKNKGITIGDANVALHLPGKVARLCYPGSVSAQDHWI